MGWIWIPIVLVALIPTVVTLLFYLIWYYDRRKSSSEHITDTQPAALPPGRAIGAVLVEALALSVLVLGYPLRLMGDRVALRDRQSGRRPVVLVHGYGGNGTNFLWLRWYLRRRGFANCYAISYRPPHINCRKLAAQVAEQVERVLAITGAEQVDLVCHSMGGPLSRYALKHLGLAGKVGKVITLGSPHYGTRIAALFAARGAAAQMRYHSPFVMELAEGGECPGGARFYCLYSEMDNFVFPPRTATLAAAQENVQVPFLGHCSLLYSRRVAAMVRKYLLLPDDRQVISGGDETTADG